MMKNENNTLTTEQIDEISEKSDGYSCADVVNLCKEAALGPVRAAMDAELIETIRIDELRAITFDDFQDAFAQVKSSVSPAEIEHYIQFNQNFGALRV